MKKVARKSQKPNTEDLLSKVEHLESRLAEAEETLRAIRNGEVDALAIETDTGTQIFTLTGADQSYRIMVETMNEGAMTMVADGTIVYCNQRFADIVKTPLENIIGNSIYRFIKPGREAFFKKFVGGVSEKARKETFFRAADGTSIPVLLSMSNRCDATSPICLLVTDISELRKAQKNLQESYNDLELKVKERTRKLQESEDRYRMAIKAANDAIWDIDLTTGTVHWNETYAAAFGRPPEADKSWQWWIDRIHPDDRERTADGLQAAIDGRGDSWICEYRFLRADGTWAYIYDRAFIARDESGKARRVIGAMLDFTERKRDEEEVVRLNRELQQRVQEMEAVFHTAPIGLAIAEDPEGRHIRGNPFNEQILGLPRGAELSKLPSPGQAAARYRVLKDGREVAVEELPMQRAVRGETVSGQIMDLVLEDGRTVKLYSNASPLLDEQGRPRGAVGAFMDITELTLAHNALQRSEFRYRTVAENTYDFEFWINPEGRFLYASHSCKRIYGRDPAEFLADPSLQRNAVHPDDLAAFDQHVADEQTKRCPGEAEYRIVSPDGAHRWIAHACLPVFDEKGQYMGVRGSNRDITERKRVEVALASSRNQLQNIIDNTSALVYVFDLEERFLIANRALAELLNSSPRQMIGKRRREFMPDDTAARHEANDREVIKAGKALEFEEYGEFKGQAITFLTSKFPLRDPQGSIYAVAGISSNITERKQMEDALKTYSEKLEEAYREIESFSYSVSHDLRAPLRAIDGFARMLLKKHGQEFDEDSMRKFNVIRSNAQMMGQLIDDILTLSRLGRKEMSLEVLDMDAVVWNVWKDLHIDAQNRRIDLKVNDMPPGRGDRTLIKQVYSNLLSNAAKFTKYRDPALIEVGGRVDGNENVYYVKDNGVGFEMEYYDKLFGVFQRLHKADEFEGTGIGLATVERVIRRHGGRVWAEGKLDEGATFYFSLPSSHTDNRR